MPVGLLKKPLFWIGLIIVLIIGLLIFILELNSISKPKSSQSSPQKLSQKLKSGPKPGSCLVLEQKYCGNGKIIEWKSPTGQIFKLVAFNLPADIPIFAPFDGQLLITDSKKNPISPNIPMISIYNSKGPNTPIFSISGNTKIENNFNKKSAEVKKGDIIGYIQNTDIKILDNTIVLTFTKLDSITKTFIVDEEKLLKIYKN
ncbi:MAG: hypothetical protein AAB675_00495 [Patescibacteria group bacterium]